MKIFTEVNSWDPASKCNDLKGSTIGQVKNMLMSNNSHDSYCAVIVVENDRDVDNIQDTYMDAKNSTRDVNSIVIVLKTDSNTFEKWRSKIIGYLGGPLAIVNEK